MGRLGARWLDDDRGCAAGSAVGRGQGQPGTLLGTCSHEASALYESASRFESRTRDPYEAPLTAGHLAHGVAERAVDAPVSAPTARLDAFAPSARPPYLRCLLIEIGRASCRERV